MSKISKALERAEAERQKRLDEIRQAARETAEKPLRVESPARHEGLETAGGEESTAVSDSAVAVETAPADGMELTRPETSVGVLEAPLPSPPKIASEAAIDERIVTLFDPRSVIAEQYRILRTNLLSLRSGKPIKVIMISSAMNAEGKTVSAVNLAVTLANDINQRRVLIVDSDLRAGTVHQLFGLRPKLGLSDVLAKGVPWQEVVIGSPLPNLTVLPRGVTPPNPAELVASHKMRQLVAEWRSQYDFCIIDTPPIVPLTDPSILGSLTDGAVLVIRGGRTQRTMVQYAMSLLTQANVQTLGCILTHAVNTVPEYVYRYF